MLFIVVSTLLSATFALPTQDAPPPGYDGTHRPEVQPPGYHRSNAVPPPTVSPPEYSLGSAVPQHALPGDPIATDYAMGTIWIIRGKKQDRDFTFLAPDALIPPHDIQKPGVYVYRNDGHAWQFFDREKVPMLFPQLKPKSKKDKALDHLRRLGRAGRS